MFSNSGAGKLLQDNTFDDGLLCSSPTPLATSTAKKKLNTLPCTSLTQSAAKKMSSAAGDHLLADKAPQVVLTEQNTSNIFKHPGLYLPEKTSSQQTRKRQSGIQQQRKSQGAEKLPSVAAKENTKLNISVISEQSIVSNASSMGLIPDDLLNNDILEFREQSPLTKSMEPSHSSDLSDIEQARRCPAEDSYKDAIHNGSHFASAHAFLQLQGIKSGINANVTQPKITLGEEEILKLDKDFGLEEEDISVLDDLVSESAPISATPVKMELNGVETNATKLIETQGNNPMDELSLCSSPGFSEYNSQSFSLEKMLRGNKEDEDKAQLEEMLEHNFEVDWDKKKKHFLMNAQLEEMLEHNFEVDWDKKQTFSCDPPDNKLLETSKLYDEDPFETELAYRTEFDADLAKIQNVALSSEFVSFESAAAKLDADEAEFFEENANMNFDEVLQVPLAQDVENWSYHTHISFSTPTNHERMSLGTYMHTRSEPIKNTDQSLFNSSQAEAELPVLEELEEEDLEDIVSKNPENKDAEFDKSLPTPALTQSIISNSLISNILDMASMSMSNDEIANRFVAQLDKRQRSRSGTKRDDIPSLNSNTETPVPFKPDVSQSVVSNFQSKRISDENLVSCSTQSTPCSTHTLIDQSSCTLEELKSSMIAGTQNQSYGSFVATKNNRSPPPAGMKFRTSPESIYMPQKFEKCKNVPDKSKLNCHLKFDETEEANTVVSKEGLSKKSSIAASHQKNTEEVKKHSLEKSDKRNAPGLTSCAINQNAKDCGEPGVTNKSVNDLSSVMPAMINVTDARKIQAIMNRNRNEVDETCPWQTIMEESLGQTQINFNVFSSTLLEEDGCANDVKGNVGNFLASVGMDSLKKKPKFEIDRVIKVPDCIIGISEKALVTVRNMVDHWLECHIDILHLFVNGREVSIRTYNPFRMKEKLVLGPMATQKFEVVFFPKDSGSYMADVRVSSGSHKVTTDPKTHDDDDHMTCYMKLNSYADLPSVNFSPKELDFGQQSWGSSGCLPITVANKSKAKIPLRLVICSKSSNVFRWGHKPLPDMPGSEFKYTVVSDNICCLTLPGAQAGCVLNFTSLDIICDLVKKNALKDPNQSTSLIGIVEIQLDVPSTQPPLGIIQLVVTAGTAKLHVSNGADLIVMETSISKPAHRTVTLRNAGTLDLNVALDISRHEQVFTLDSGYVKIPVGEKADINVTFHPQDDTVKSYNVEMMMFLEPSGPVFGIPVQGKVMAKSRSHPRQHRWLLADLSNINFGGIPLGQPKEITFRLKNISSSIAKIELVVRSEARVFKFSTLLNSFTRLSDSKSIVIQPNDVYPVTVVFNPTRGSVFNGKVNIKSSDDSTRFVIPLLGYGGLSEVFLTEPCSGILKINEIDASSDSSQTSNFTLRNSGIRDAFFCVQIYQDSEKSVLANKQAFAIHPQNGILKSLEKNTITLLCNRMAMASLPVHIAIYHGDEEARQQMKRALKKFPNQRDKWKWSEWFDTVFTNEDDTQNCDLTLSQRSDLNVFFDHLSTMELTVGLNKKTINNRWSSKNQSVDLNSKAKDASLFKEKQDIPRPNVKPVKEIAKKDTKMQRHLPNEETDKENVSNTKVGHNTQMSSEVAHKAGGRYSLLNKSAPTDQQKIWRLMPEQLTFVSKDYQMFSIINFGDKSLNFQLSWATDRMSVSNSVVTISPHAVSEIFVSPCNSESWEGFIYVTAESHMQKVAVSYKGHPDNSTRQPLQSKSDHNCVRTPTTLTSPESRSVEFPLRQNSDSNQPLHLSQPDLKAYRHTSDYSKLLPTSSQQPSVSAGHGPDPDHVIEISPVNHSKEQIFSATSPQSLPFGLGEEDAVDVRMDSEIIKFYVESGYGLVNNYLEFTNFGKTEVKWTLNNWTSFPYFSSNDGKRTVMKSYDIFKIFQTKGTLSAGQTCRVHILFYPEMLFDKKFICFHACKLICQQANAPSHHQPTVIPFLLQGFLTSDRCSLDSLMSGPSSSISSIASSVASSTVPNATSSCYSDDKKLILQPDVVTFQPSPIGKVQQIEVQMKNRNNEPVKVIIEGSREEDVFSVSVKSFMINSKKLVKIPISFKPVFKGFANSKIIFSSGKTSLTLQLFGVGF